MERMIAKAILQERGNIQAKISSQIQKAIDNHIPSQVDASVRSYMSGHILNVRQKTSEYEAYCHILMLQMMKKYRLKQVSTRIIEGRDEQQHHIDQDNEFPCQRDIVWASRKEILVSPHPRKTTPLVQSCQRDPEAPTLSDKSRPFVSEERKFRA
ncbi:hypothetical protein Tco_1073335 [Tanacetum coccineum]